MNPVFSISILIVTLLLAAGVFFYSNKSQKKQKSADTKDQVTAQEFTNVKDIRDKYLYTRDNYIFMYLKLDPLSIDLLSRNEKISLTRQLTAELSGDQETLKLLAVSRPVDISPLINEYSEILTSATNQKQKELLRKETSAISNYALSGEVIERQFYFPIWQRFEDGSERDITRRVQDIKGAFEGSKVSAEILKGKDIVRLGNLINNPAYVHIEEMSSSPSFPILT